MDVGVLKYSTSPLPFLNKISVFVLSVSFHPFRKSQIQLHWSLLSHWNFELKKFCKMTVKIAMSLLGRVLFPLCVSACISKKNKIWILKLLTPVKARTSHGEKKKGKDLSLLVFSLCMNASSDLQIPESLFRIEGPFKYFNLLPTRPWKFALIETRHLNFPVFIGCVVKLISY